VFRTFPIRVAGAQAGPLNEEISWEQLQAESNSPTPLYEYMSVTRKLRRLGRFDWEEARRAIILNRPTRLALNFADYLGFENRFASRWDQLNAKARSFAHRLENFKVPVTYIGTGPQLAESILPDVANPSDQAPAICLPSLQTRATTPGDVGVDLRRS
jgi:adenylosuccinate synthase